jgi:hypothetical protein
MATHLSYDVLSRLVERRASAVEDAKAQRHLAGCGRCRSELAWLERIRTIPQRPTDLGSSRTVGDGWGNIVRRPAAGDFGSGDPGESRNVAAYWLRGGRSALAD